MAALFACTKCNSRHPFEELSQGQQLCKECRGSYPIVKCTYCRSEFQQENKGSTTTICKKCAQNVKLYGKPTACEYCNTIAAFIGPKCQRCTNSEKKYGPPLTCEQCKQRCAFERKDDSRKKIFLWLELRERPVFSQLQDSLKDEEVDGKLLCWLCTLSYKRALAKSRKQRKEINSASAILRRNSQDRIIGDRRSHLHKNKTHHNSHSNHTILGSPNKKIMRIDVTASNGTTTTTASTTSTQKSFNSDSIFGDPNSSDHMVAVTQLREQIAALQKQLQQKDQVIMDKDKQIAELKAHQMVLDKEFRTKATNVEKKHTENVVQLQNRVRTLQKQVISLNKSNKDSKKPCSPAV